MLKSKMRRMRMGLRAMFAAKVTRQKFVLVPLSFTRVRKDVNGSLQTVMRGVTCRVLNDSGEVVLEQLCFERNTADVITTLKGWKIVNVEEVKEKHKKLFNGLMKDPLLSPKLETRWLHFYGERDALAHNPIEFFA